MSQVLPRTRSLMALLLVGASLSLGACDDPVEVEREPEVATIRLTAGSQTVTVNVASGAVTGGPLSIPTGGSVLEVEFLRADGQPDPVVTTAAYRLDVTPTNTAVVTFGSFTSGSEFGGIFIGLQSGGSTLADIALFDLEEQHDEFTWPVTVQVQ